MALTFNIIYTAGTVQYLTFFVFSLLRCSDCSFRLVTNGCSLAEEQSLQQFCRKNDRLTFYRLPTEQLMPHGRALNHLQSLNHEDHFCFMDSDIYATGEFLAPFLQLSSNYTGLFSCSPVWCKTTEQILSSRNPIMAGEFNRTETGLCLGGTYFSIYDNAVLTAFRQSTKIGFERCQWAEIERPYQRRLCALQLKKEIYDTGKLLNLFLQDQGHQLATLETDRLIHLGGASDISRIREAAKVQNTRRERWQQRYYRLQIRLRRLWQPEYFRFEFSERRGLYKLYWGEYLSALVENRAPPIPPQISEAEIRDRIAAITPQIATLYQQFVERPTSAQ
ncbi:hypothetical protein BH10CHL1_BH10CHL1_41590 [soil metagenome]